MPFRPQLPVIPRPTGRLPSSPGSPALHDPNFGLLFSDTSWRNSWSTIIAGRFSPSPFSTLMFVEEGTAYAELYYTDGSGHIRTPLLAQFNPLGGRTTWTHIVPGFFGPSGFTGLLLYDSNAGFGRFFDSDGKGGLILLSEYPGWRSSWTHIVAGRFTGSAYSSVFFYSASEKYGEIWDIDGKGLAGTAPHQTFPDFGNRAFTHVVVGDFHWTPGFIDQVSTYSDLFVYDGLSGHGEMYRCDDSGILTAPTAVSDSLPLGAALVAAGNFSGLGNTDIIFYDGTAGSLAFYAFEDTSDTSANIGLRETQSGLRKGANLLVVGKFWASNLDDHWFSEGPPSAATPPFDPDWRYGTGAFSDLLIYANSASTGDFYFHEPVAPTTPPLEGYISSRTSHPNAPNVSTGSVLPGESIAFHISSQDGPYSIAIFREAIFADEVEQPMGAVGGLPANASPFRSTRTAYRDGAGWPAAAEFTVPDTWPSGLYLARVQTSGASASTIDLPFVVRARPTARCPVLVILADATYCAYNVWGGRNAYGYLSGDDFVGAFPSASAMRVPFGFQLSFERPVDGRFNNIPQAVELPFLQWLSRRGVPFDVCTSRDLHFEPPDARQYRLLLFAGHHEYWTQEMRNNTEGFGRSGGNVAFFSGNVCWWQVRLSADGSQQSCYKVAGFDPVSSTPDHSLTTVQWFDDHVKRPETTLTGVSFLGNDGIYYDTQHRFQVKNATHWVFAGTGLNNSDSFGGYGGPGNDQNSVCGTETDRVQSGGPNGLSSPAGYTLASIYDLVYPTLEVGTMGIFRPPGQSSGQTYNAATINWALGLDIDQTSWNLIDQITLNVIGTLGPPRPLPWASVSEGRSTPGAPITPALVSPNQIALLLADPGGGVYAASGFPGVGWGPWGSVSQGQSTPGAPITAVLTKPNQVTLFLADPAGGVYTASGFPGVGWGPWESVSQGQSTPGAPITAVLTASNQVTLFLADPGGGIYTASGFPGVGWGPWSDVSQGSSTPGGHVTALLTGNNVVTLFLSDPAGGIYTTSGSAVQGWAPWTSVAEGRSTPGDRVSAVLLAPNRIALFMAGSQGGILSTAGNVTDGWLPWTSLSEGRSTAGGAVTAVLTVANRVAVFLADPLGGVFTTATAMA